MDIRVSAGQTQQLGRRLAVAALDLAQALHAAGEELDISDAPYGGVNLAGEALVGERAQVGEQILADIGQKGADLLVVDHAHQRDTLSSGKDQGVQAHGDHHLHPGEKADGVVGSSGVLDDVVGGLHIGGRLPGSLHIQSLFDGQKDRSQAVCFPGIVRRPPEEFGLLLKAGPGAEVKPIYRP